jgi:hypothetical protein
MEGYGPDNEYSQSQVGQEWSQNSEWMTRFPVPNFSENPQLQFAHGPNMFTSGQSAFEGYPSPPYRRLPPLSPSPQDIEVETLIAVLYVAAVLWPCCGRVEAMLRPC